MWSTRPSPARSGCRPDEPAGGSAAAGTPRVTRPAARLAASEGTLNERAEPFSISPQAVSKHLKVLERAGLITRGRDAQRRPARLAARPLKEATDWLENYRAYWEESFQ